MPVALVREVPDSFVRAIVGTRGRAPDVALAKEQHRDYVKRLTGAGYSIERLAADEACPDCVFVEDTAVILGEVAVVTRPGAESRRSEVAAVAGFLEKRFEMAQIEEPGTVDGGDVMIVDGKVYVGESARTNRDGIAQLASITAEQGLELIPVPVVGMLHLKSAVVPVGDQTVVVTQAPWTRWCWMVCASSTKPIVSGAGSVLSHSSTATSWSARALQTHPGRSLLSDMP